MQLTLLLVLVSLVIGYSNNIPGEEGENPESHAYDSSVKENSDSESGGSDTRSLDYYDDDDIPGGQNRITLSGNSLFMILLQYCIFSVLFFLSYSIKSKHFSPWYYFLLYLNIT